MFDRTESTELLELIFEQLNRTGYSEEHAAELPLSFTVPALAREIDASVPETQAALDFLASQGRVMARRHSRSGQLLYKLPVEGDTNHAEVSPRPRQQSIAIALGNAQLVYARRRRPVPAHRAAFRARQAGAQ